MGALRLLPGEKEELHLHPAASTFLARQLWALAFVLYGGLLWAGFHSPWWTEHRPSDWTAAWTWLWGTPGAAYLWTLTGLALGGAAACRPRGPRTKLWVALAAGLLVCGATRLWAPGKATDVLPVLTMCAALPVLAWLETRRLATHYHVTNLRLVVRTTLPRRTERSALYSDLVDLDARGSPWPDTGTLITVAAKPPESGAPPPPLHMPGIRPFARVRSLVALLAQRATASERGKADGALDEQVAEALAALHRP